MQSLESRDVELARLNSELQKLDAEMLSAGKKLSAARKKVIPQLAKAVGKQLADLGFKQSKFDVAVTTDFVGDEVTSLKSKESQSLLTSEMCIRDRRSTVRS